MNLWLCVSLVLAWACLSLAGDQCNPYPTCEECLKHQYCGWCSHEVIYKDNSQGYHCAGFESNGSTPGFVCLGVFSTEQCLRGYRCNHTTFVCNLAQEGEGDPLDTCMKECGGGSPVAYPPPPPPADVFKCDQTNFTCLKVAPGTSGATSLDICLKQCNSSHVPVPSPPQPPAPAPVFACNYSTWNCDQVNAGNPNATSKLICQQLCDRTHGLWQCNVDQNYTCTPAPSGQPGVPLDVCKSKCFEQFICDTNSYTCRKVSASGMPRQDCEAQCKAPQPQPGTPPELDGLWRGVQINLGFGRGEWDVLFDNGTFKIYVMGHGVVTGLVQYNPLNFDLNLLCQSGPWQGKRLLALYALEAPGPETAFMTLAFGPLNGPRPTSITGALNDRNSLVFALGKCLVNTLCSWNFPPSMAPVLHGFGVDHCSPWPTCSVCLAHEFCGWCSLPVIYPNGTQGSRCAGVAPSDDPFKCTGNYRTSDCFDYRCNKDTYQCIEVEAGTGQPLETCQQNCKPPPDGYKCNLTTSKCDKVPPNSGGTSIESCLIACRAHTGPPPVLFGQWRGVAIQHGYKVGEIDVNFNETGVTFVYIATQGTEEMFSASLYSQGNILTLGVATGPMAGSVILGVFDVTPATFNFLTLALSGPNGPLPNGYDSAPMTGGAGGSEYILVKGSL